MTSAVDGLKQRFMAMSQPDADGVYRNGAAKRKARTDLAMGNLTQLWNEVCEAVSFDVPATGNIENNRYLTVRHRAEELLADLDTVRNRQKYANQRIRIFVTTHKNVSTFNSAIMQPVQVGLHNGSYRFPWAFHDDEGENISNRNPRYCELTTQYWAWKNIDADYYGFCHYRRYFDFSETVHEENAFGEIMDDYISVKTAKEYGLDDDNIARVVRQYDVITTPFGDLDEIIDSLIAADQAAKLAKMNEN